MGQFFRFNRINLRLRFLSVFAHYPCDAIMGNLNYFILQYINHLLTGFRQFRFG